MLYKKNDIIAIAIVYEGHLPQGHVLDERALASEIIDRAHQSGLSPEFKLSPHTATMARRADESAFFAGSYEPVDDLPAMLNDCIRDVRRRIVATGEVPGPVSVKSMQFKGWSSVVSTVWVGIHIQQ